MKEPREDDERLAALLEGRVEGAQREDLLARLAEADDDYEVFTDTGAVLRALEEEDARAGQPVAGPSMRRGGWRSPGRRTAIAVAGTLVLLLAVGLVLRGRDASSAHHPLQLAMRADPAGQGLPEGWEIPPPSGATRGPGRAAAREARAVRAGAMLVDLFIAVRTRNTERTRVLAAQLIAHSAPGASTGTPLGQIAANPGAPPDSLNALLGRATERLTHLGRDALELGAWLEAARLAAAAQNAAFFDDGASRDMLRRAERLAGDNESARAAVTQVRAALSAEGAPRWEALGTGLKAVLAEISG